MSKSNKFLTYKTTYIIPLKIQKHPHLILTKKENIENPLLNWPPSRLPTHSTSRGEDHDPWSWGSSLLKCSHFPQSQGMTMRPWFVVKVMFLSPSHDSQAYPSHSKETSPESSLATLCLVKGTMTHNCSCGPLGNSLFENLS